ncbi:MAG: transposase [Thermoplasmataceae archaeon]
MQIILDNASYFHAKLLKQWIEEQKEFMFLDFLPPYSPKLNPILRVWKLLKKLRLHNQYFPDLKGVIKVAVKQFLLWSKEDESLKTLCHMEGRYIYSNTYFVMYSMEVHCVLSLT